MEKEMETTILLRVGGSGGRGKEVNKGDNEG